MDQVTRQDLKEVAEVGVTLGIEATEVKIGQGYLDDVLTRKGARADGEAVISGEVVLDGVQALDSAIVVVKFEGESDGSHGFLLWLIYTVWIGWLPLSSSDDVAEHVFTHLKKFAQGLATTQGDASGDEHLLEFDVDGVVLEVGVKLGCVHGFLSWLMSLV